MKLLVVELYPERGHLPLFNNIVRLLEEKHDVTAICPKSVTLKGNSVNQIIASYDYYETKEKNKIKRIIGYVKYSCNVCKYVGDIQEKIDFDAMIVVTYNEVGFAFGKKYLKNLDRVFLMAHNNLDLIIKSNIKKYLFKQYCYDVKHIVLCKFIAEEMSRTLGIPQSKIAIWKHPLTSIIEPKENIDMIYDCVGISNSNDEKIISEIITLEKETGFIKNAGLKVVLRTSNEVYNDGSLIVIKGFLKKEEYEHYINNAKCIFLPFPSSFKFRMSGTLVDAFSNNKPVIVTSIPLFEACKLQYPQITEIYVLDKFVEQIIKMESVTNEQFNNFIQCHSDASIMLNMNVELERIMKNKASNINIDF